LKKAQLYFIKKFGVVNSVAISDGQQLLLMLYYSH